MTEKSTFARRVRAAKPRATKYEIRDDVVSGLALTIQPTEIRTFFFARMVRGRRRYATIGNADAMTIPEARREARRLIAAFTETVRNDGGLRTPGHPMKAFAEEFLDRQAHGWKPRTQEANSRFVRKNILPAFGTLTVDAITVERVRDWFAAMSDRPGVANRAMPVLSMMMRMAELWGYRPHNSNPCRNTRRYRMKPVERFLTEDEMARLVRALDANEGRWPEAVAAVRLLALTGCRRSEVLDLRWRNISDDALNLEDSKTGPRSVPLSASARALIEALPGPRDPDAFLFPRHAEGRGIWVLTNFWRAACVDAGLGRLRLHDLRHTAASQAVMAVENLPLVGKLLGHRRHRTTAGYAHVDDTHLVEAAEKVGKVIAKAMEIPSPKPQANFADTLPSARRSSLTALA